MSETGNPQSGVASDSADVPPTATSIVGAESQRDNTTNRSPEPPSWVEISTLIVLTLTLAAACLAGYEASRLADLTQIAINDARHAADQQQRNTESSLRLTRRAIEVAADSANAAKTQAAAAKLQAEAGSSLAKIAHDTYIVTRRAWLGPSDASLKSAPKVGKPLEVEVTYRNTGREPATHFSLSQRMLIAPLSADAKTSDRIRESLQQCLSRPVSRYGTVLYPTTGSAAYGASLKGDFKNSDIADLLSGKSVLYYEGCLVYQSLHTAHHSFFCYYYRSSVSDVAHLSICENDDAAD